MEEKQTFYQWLEGVVQPFRDWIVNNHNNPILWIGLFLAGILAFNVCYNALHKDK